MDDRPNTDRLTYPVPMDNGTTAYLDLPRQITTADAERIAGLTAALPYDQEGD